MAWPYTYNFNYYVGDLLQFVLYPKQEDEEFSLSGYTSLFVVATERGNPNAVVISASPQMSASPSRLLCTITPQNGMLMTGASYLYDIEITKGNETYTLMTGTISTQLDVSRA